MYLLLSDGRLMYKNHPRPAISYMLNELICSFDSYHICRHYKSKLDDLMRKVVVEHATFVSLSPQSWNYSLKTSCCSFFPWKWVHTLNHFPHMWLPTKLLAPLLSCMMCRPRAPGKALDSSDLALPLHSMPRKRGGQLSWADGMEVRVFKAYLIRRECMDG